MATTGFSAAAALTCLGWSLTALGQETPSTTTQLASATPYTVAEFGVGILALPTTDICLAQPNTCTKGDLTPHGWIWMLYRASSEFVVGAGTSLARPFSGETTKRTEQIEREHIRQYMMIDVTGRYYGLRLPSVEGWLGMTFGGAVISDQYKTTGEASDAVILGPAGVVVRTEGLSAGIAAGLGWAFAPNWTLESSFRSAWWFLPSDWACGTTVDCATLSDDVAIFSLGIGVGYRISL